MEGRLEPKVAGKEENIHIFFWEIANQLLSLRAGGLQVW